MRNELKRCASENDAENSMCGTIGLVSHLVLFGLGLLDAYNMAPDLRSNIQRYRQNSYDMRNNIAGIIKRFNIDFNQGTMLSF